MKAFIWLAVLGSIVSLVSCKPIARETESQPEFFGVVPKYVRNFLKAAKRNPNSIGPGEALRGNPLKGAIISTVDEAYSSEVLEWAVQHGKYNILKEVVEGTKRHNLRVSDWDLSEAIYLATRSNRDSNRKINYLIEQGASIDTALYFAGKNGDIDGIRHLTRHGAKVKDLDEALEGAVYAGKMEIVPYLVKMGADPNVGMKEAIGMGKKDLNTVMQLVELGANDFDEGLRVAAIYGRIDIAEYMVSKGATDVNKALAFATGEVYDKPDAAKLVKYLLERGATNIEEALENVTSRIRMSRGDFPRDIKNRAGWAEIQKILQEALNNTP